MSGRDIRFGRQGGRWVDATRVIAGIDDVDTVVAICPHGHLQRLAAKDYDEAPIVDGRPVRRQTVGAPCPIDRHRTRRATAAEISSPPAVIRVAYRQPDPCPCGVSA